MKLYHGSNIDGLACLDPQKGIFDPNDWAGIYPNGEKIGREVVWCTPEFEIAIAFALKDFVEDLAVDGRSGILYVKSKTSLTSDMKGYVYTIPQGIAFEKVNELEYFSRNKIPVSSCETVSIDSFTTYQVEIVEKFPFEEE